VGQWIEDFAKRVKQLQQLCLTPLDKLGSVGIWLGGLFNPEAFVTASRQTVAQENKWCVQCVQCVLSCYHAIMLSC
jgi:dynein heavy chain 1